MLSAFSFFPEAVNNTAIIAERCNVEFEFGKIKLPYFDVPDNQNHIEYFNSMCKRGLIEKYGPNPPKEYVDRMDYELNVINSMGYTDYYLIVHDFVSFAKNNNIPVGPGRGSGAASICAYCIGITGIDPMKYNLLFERFLNPERVSMPDFDIDFCYERREEVINYVTQKYGSDKVSQIVTFGTLAAKAAIRDVGRALGIPYSNVDTIARLIPNDLNITINQALEKSKDLYNLYNSDYEAKKLIDLSVKVEGMPRHTSTHAAGVVITDVPTVDYVPLALNDNSVVTQYTMKNLDKLGLLKMDFLGLRTLTVIKKAVDYVKIKDKNFDINQIDIENKKVYELFSKAETNGVFQFESDGMKRVLQQLKPSNIEDIIAILALYRPGPMDSIPQYIENKNHPDKIVYKTEKLKPILDVTYGCIVYQEQVMQICREIAGYSFGRADIVRRAVAKKQHDVMLKERNNFVNGITDEKGNVICDGAVRRGLDEKTANEIFDSMVSFASYAFNKAHATSYAYLSYQTAYLKCYYPKEFFATMMSCYIESSGKIIDYCEECSKLGIKVKAPDINQSCSDFTIDDDSIIFSLTAIKNTGKGFADRIASERAINGKYKSLYDFSKRLRGKDLNKRNIESLIKAGAFDNLGANRHQMLNSVDKLFEQIDDNFRRNISGQIGFSDLFKDDSENQIADYVFDDIPELPSDVLLKYEKEVSGLYLSGHPMKEYDCFVEALKCVRIRNITSENYKKDDKIKIAALISSVQRKTTKNNANMAFLEAEDVSGSVEIITFSKVYENFRNLLFEGNILLISGRIDVNDENQIKILADFIEPFPSKNELEKLSNKSEKQNKSKNLYIRFETSSSPQIKVIKNVLSIFDGNVKTYFYFSDTKKYEFVQLTQIDDILLSEMRKILGKENVIY